MFNLFFVSYICAVIFVAVKSSNILLDFYLADERAYPNHEGNFPRGYEPEFTIGSVLFLVIITFTPIINVVATTIFLVDLLFDVIAPFFKEVFKYPVVRLFKKKR